MWWIIFTSSVVAVHVLLLMKSSTCQAEQDLNDITLYLKIYGTSCAFPYKKVGTAELEPHAVACCEEHFNYDEIQHCLDYVIRAIEGKALEYYKAATKCIMMLCPTPSDTHMLIESYQPHKLLRASVGALSYINEARFHWWGESGAGLSIGRYVQGATDIEFFLGGNHCYKKAATYPFEAFFPENFPKIKTEQNKRECPYSNGPIVIGHDVWIGTGASIFSGVTIGHGAIIGAHAVVRKDVPPFAIVVGNPGTIVGYRHNEEQVEALLRIAWWDWEPQRVVDEAHMVAQDDVDLFIEMYDLPVSSSVALDQDCVKGAACN